MVLVHTEYHKTKYTAPRCSWAYLAWLTCWLASIVAPYIFAYHMNNLWLKEAVSVQQPRARFKHMAVMSLQSNSIGGDLHWCTESSINALYRESTLRMGEVSSVEIDDDRDGKPDTLEVTLAMPVLSGEAIYHASAALFFNYTLDQAVDMTMEGVAYVEGGGSVSGSQLWVAGDLRLRQLQPIYYKSAHTRYTESVLKTTRGATGIGPQLSDVQFSTILGSYNQRNLTTYIGNKQQVWSPGDHGSPDGSSRFEIVVQLRIPEEQVRYTPGFWETMKMAWVQYLAIFLLIRFFVGYIEVFLYEFRLLDTTVTQVQIINNKPNF